MSIKWNKSAEGYVSSKCERFDIEPVYMGRTTAQAFSVYYRLPFSDKREQLKRYADTQRDAKAVAEDHLVRLEKKTATVTVGPTVHAFDHLSKFEVGNQVRVLRRDGSKGDTIYEIVSLLPGFGCTIREIGTAPNSKPYAAQRFDTSMLAHAVTDEMLKAFSFGPLKASR